MKYSDLMAEWLAEMGYTHCFYVGGGNIMHILASAAKHFTMVATVHEVAAGIAAEYFNETHPKAKAFALVTAGPGLTNVITAMGGAWLESRELLVLGGQVKTADLAHGQLRQRGIQEIDGVALAAPTCKLSRLVDNPLDKASFHAAVATSWQGRKGPVFLELPLDIQGRTVDRASLETVAVAAPAALPQASAAELDALAARIRAAKRPSLLIGGGVSREAAAAVRERFEAMGLPVLTTWNGADRLGADHPLYFGRPNTWGMRYSNLIMQQSDVLVALGTRLGMQQTGFNWQQFVPGGAVVQVDIDPAELSKGHPRLAQGLCADADSVLRGLAERDLGQHGDWVARCRDIAAKVPLAEANQTGAGYLSPHQVVRDLASLCKNDDVVIPCSSGGAFTIMMMNFRQKSGQLMVTNKGLASMGYGLSGAIGAAFAHRDKRTILVEGDGGFAQNLQEIGTAAVNQLNLKMFLFDDNGYASIRMTQRNYFGGDYIGCDIKSGLGLPNWEALFAAWNVPVLRLPAGFEKDARFLELFNSTGPAAFIVTIDPEQTYFPKITSRVTPTGMESNPLHKMSPDLPPELEADVLRDIP